MSIEIKLSCAGHCTPGLAAVQKDQVVHAKRIPPLQNNFADICAGAVASQEGFVQVDAGLEYENHSSRDGVKS